MISNVSYKKVKMQLKINQPPIVCYLHHAYPLTSAMHHEDFNSWFFSNYIQLEYRCQTKEVNFFTYVICGNSVFIPILDYKILDLEFIFKSNIDIIEFIKNSIENGYYVTTYIDEFFIPERTAYKNNHFRHDIMIYGFDLNKKIFNVTGYNDRSDYATSSVDFSDFKNAYLNSINKQNDLILFKPKDNGSYNPSFTFDIENVKNLLYDYVFSQDSSHRLRAIGNPKENFTYGIEVYNELMNCYRWAIEIDKKVCDIRQPHLLYEHKKTMVDRIHFLVAKKYLKREYDFASTYTELKINALKMRNVIIKYNKVNDKSLINRSIENLQNMFEKEKKTAQDLLEAISDNVAVTSQK
ncbi:hypothetical protein [Ruminiclostridium papyrosolvens]|uniref:Butirosin biosynthesis protein H N-terminal domain-containing protein n=1 Tax=Ruminiclostridium papyrosolvens C7 TaxID=1330534 RepID=U4R008_9FIRM|nr:hypothetical protein [Ruminiclostridium papyrosolvens]EPR10592.1 hypothetical protein L323_13830 [Ruminiclostridium papyrosolvens C7]